MATVVIGGKKLKLDPTNAIGKGGEADVYDLGNGTVAKVFKGPHHPDLLTQPEKDAAIARIAEHQLKLPAFPQNLPLNVVAPNSKGHPLVLDPKGPIVGYVMDFLAKGEVLLRYGERQFRQNVPQPNINKIFLNMHTTISGIHKSGVVIGDFNDLNVMVVGTDAFFIDADSMQFGPYQCHVFTAKFVDPVLCAPDKMMLVKPHNSLSDWYAYNVMLFQSLLFVGPYGGVYKPADKTKKMGNDRRPLNRITVFHPEVQYPKPANRLDTLPDDLLHYFVQVFEKDQRGEFPRLLLEQLEWITCKDCGLVHAKTICPACGQKGIGKVVQTVRIRGTVTATTVFKTTGTILYASVQNGKLRWLYHDGADFRRDGDMSVTGGTPENGMRYRINGDRTIIGRGANMITLDPSNPPERKSVDRLGNTPVIGGTGNTRLWIEDGVLMRDSRLGYPEKVGDVLKGQTQFWTGEKFGFGYYRAGDFYGAFVFPTINGVLNNTVNLPPIQGQIIDADCAFSDDLCWFFVKAQTGGRTINKVFVVSDSGKLIGQDETEDGDGTWLGTLRGKCAVAIRDNSGKVVKNFLMASTDDGIVRVELSNGVPAVTKEFPDTEPFVKAGDHLFPAYDQGHVSGIFVVNRHEVTRLKLA
jgi:H/ACA ribonucleoprotein complex subunit 3